MQIIRTVLDVKMLRHVDTGTEKMLAARERVLD